VNQRIRFTGPRGWQRTPAGAQETTEQAQDPERTSVAAADEPSEDTSTPTQPSARDEASWLSSSFDLRSGLHVSDFEDTVPSAWLDELGL
jgi:hypothetical protein